MRIGRIKFFTIIMYSIFLILSMLLINETENFQVLSSVIVFNFLFQIFLFYKNGYSLFSFASIFILLGQLFEFGVILLYSFDYSFSGYVLYQLSRVDQNSLYEAASYALYCVSFTFIGSLMYPKNNRTKDSANLSSGRIEYSAKLLRRTGWLLVVLFGILWGGIQVYNFYLAQFGYLTNIYNTVPSTFLTLGNFMYIGLFFLMVSAKLDGNMESAKFYFILSIILAGISMLAGVRSMGMCIIILLMIYYNAYIKTFKKNQIVLFIVVGYFLLATLTAIMHVRKDGFTLAYFLEEWFNCVTSDVIFNALEEFGLTIFVLAHEVSIFNDGGFSHMPIDIFLHEFLVGIPGLSYYYPEITLEGYDLLGLRALGSSYIADFYYYLGYAGIAFSIIWGIFLGFIDNLLHKMEIQFAYYKAGAFFSFYALILSEIRSPFRFGYKVLILTVLVLAIIKFFTSRVTLHR